MLDKLRDYWLDLMEIQEARWVIWSTLLLILIVIAIYVVKFFRDQAFSDGSGLTGSMLDEIRQWKQSGTVDEDEFEQVQQVAAQRAKQEIIGAETPPTDGTGNPALGTAPGAAPVRKSRPKTLAEMEAWKRSQAGQTKTDGGGETSGANDSPA